MKKEKSKKKFYYSDEINDDFAEMNIKTKSVDKNFKFIHKNPLWQLCSFILYYIIAFPIIWFFMRIIMRVKIVNKKALKKVKNAFIYGNHTGILDAYIPSLLTFPRKNKIIVGPNTVSIKGLKNITQMLGALPISNDTAGTKKFLEAIKYYGKKHDIIIFPEAHIWPYYTNVRNFKDSSFIYPIMLNKPIIVFFTAYTKPKGFCSFIRKANMTVYVSDPIYPDEGLSKQEAKKNLRDKAYNFMLDKTQYSNYEVIEYIRK